MAARHIVTGTHEFTYPYRLGGHIAAEFEVRCWYEVQLGRPAVLNPPPGDPPEPAEIRRIEDIQVQVAKVHPGTGFLMATQWVAADPHLEGLIRAHLHGDGAQDLIDRAGE